MAMMDLIIWLIMETRFWDFKCLEAGSFQRTKEDRGREEDSKKNHNGEADSRKVEAKLNT